MALFVISDLHVQSADDPLYGALLQWLRQKITASDTLVLAGDVFDLLVGRKTVWMDRYREFFEELALKGAQGAKIHYIEGNHDFHLRSALAAVEGLELHASETRFVLGGKRFLVAHGDLADREDYGYRALRAFFRSPLIRGFVRVAPDPWVEGIGTRASLASQAKHERTPTAIPMEKRERLRRVFRNHACEELKKGVDFVVMGHCHDADEMVFQLGDRQGQYINVGYPRQDGTYLYWSPGAEKIERRPFP